MHESQFANVFVWMSFFLFFRQINLMLHSQLLSLAKVVRPWEDSQLRKSWSSKEFSQTMGMPTVPLLVLCLSLRSFHQWKQLNHNSFELIQGCWRKSKWYVSISIWKVPGIQCRVMHLLKSIFWAFDLTRFSVEAF